MTVISHSSDWLLWQRLVMAVVGHDGECLWPLVVIWGLIMMVNGHHVHGSDAWWPVGVVVVGDQ